MIYATLATGPSTPLHVFTLDEAAAMFPDNLRAGRRYPPLRLLDKV